MTSLRNFKVLWISSWKWHLGRSGPSVNWLFWQTPTEHVSQKNEHSQQTRQSDSLKIMWIVVCVLLTATYFPPGKYLVLLRLKVHIICNKLKSYTNISVSQGQKLKWQSCISEIILSCNKAKTLFSLLMRISGKCPQLISSFLSYTLQHAYVTGKLKHPEIPAWKG